MHKLALALLLVPVVARADRITIGAAAGVTKQADDSSNQTLGVWGRVRATSRLSAQLELSRTDTGSSTASWQTASGLLVVELAATMRWVPILLAGAGLDHATYVDGHHVEGGLGLELRAASGLVIGIDARAGERYVDSERVMPYDSLWSFPSLSAGSYLSARLTVGASF
jgi:hypothetical protein